jgi:integrase/FtsZ-binding cell division protein ZapB
VRGGNSSSVSFEKTGTRSSTTSITITPQDRIPHDNLEILVQNQSNYIKRLYKEVLEANSTNARIINDYIIAEEAETNIQESTKCDKIKKLCLLTRFFCHRKCFSEMTKSDILCYLNSLRRSNDIDPTHRSIGTYNGRQMVYTKFFRWLYNPDEPDHRKRITPPCMLGIKMLPRKEKSPYKPEDIWTADDHAIFLKYCHTARDRCWHSMVHDTSARPHELLNLLIKDINFKISSDGIQYAVIHVYGKTTSWTLPLISCIPYVKEWLLSHPFANNPDSKIFVSLGTKNFGQPLTRDGLLKHYQSYYRDIYFRKLIEDPIVPQKDKESIRRLLEKPWNLYIFRHSALTHKSQILKEATLRDHAGWTTNSKMPSVYLHYFGTESCNSLLETYGINKKENSRALLLMSVECPGCGESNRPTSGFCIKCKMVLKYDSFTETVEKEKLKDMEIKDLKEKLNTLQQEQNQKFSQVMTLLRKNPRIARLKQEVLMTRSLKKKQARNIHG